MRFAVALCGEIFPGATANVELMNDPDEPARAWYCVTVLWPGAPRDCVDRSSRWNARFDAEYPELMADFTLSVIPV